jgi:hypothetical protein
MKKHVTNVIKSRMRLSVSLLYFGLRKNETPINPNTMVNNKSILLIEIFAFFALIAITKGLISTSIKPIPNAS